MGLKYVRKVFYVWCRIENHNDKAKCNTKNRTCEKIKKHLIIGPKNFHNALNLSL